MKKSFGFVTDFQFHLGAQKSVYLALIIINQKVVLHLRIICLGFNSTPLITF